MKKVAFLALALGSWTLAASSQEALRKLVFNATPDPSGGTAVTICCTLVDRFKAGELCTQVRRYEAQSGLVSLKVSELCHELSVSPSREWFISLQGNPRDALYRVDCKTEVAFALQPAAAPAPPTPPPTTGQAAGSQPADSSASGGGKSRQPEADKLNNRLDSVEKTLKEQKSAVKSLQEEIGNLRGTSGGDFEKKLEAFRKEMLDRLQALEEAQRNSCYRIDDEFKGQNEVMISVAGSVLRFIKVKPRESAVQIGLSEAKAGELLAEAQGQSDRKIFPHIYLSVPEAVREVKPFYLQDRLIDARLYARLTGGKDAARVSYQDVDRFIAELNARCSGRARFELPSEEQFVAAAQWRYDPVANGLKSCDAVRKEDLRFEVTQLLGQIWQLTRSLCQPFSEPPRMSCPDSSSYVRKGGAASSTSWLECMPEYRSPAPFDVSQKETSFRLALAE